MLRFLSMYLVKGVKKTIRLTPEQAEKLKKVALITGKSQAQLIRDGLDLLLIRFDEYAITD